MTIKGSFSFGKICELIDDFKINQQIQGRKNKYNEYLLENNYFISF